MIICRLCPQLESNNSPSCWLDAIRNIQVPTGRSSLIGNRVAHSQETVRQSLKSSIRSWSPIQPSSPKLRGTTCNAIASPVCLVSFASQIAAELASEGTEVSPSSTRWYLNRLGFRCHLQEKFLCVLFAHISRRLDWC